MIILWFILGFLSACAAFSAAVFIYAAKKGKTNLKTGNDDGFLSILKY